MTDEETSTGRDSHGARDGDAPAGRADIELDPAPETEDGELTGSTRGEPGGGDADRAEAAGQSWSATAVGDADSQAANVRAPRRRRRQMSPRARRVRTLVVVILVLVVPLLLLGGFGLWVYWEIDPPGDPGDPVAVTLEAGWGVKQIADHLDDQGIVGSSLAFQIYARATGSDEFQAGDYELVERMGVRDAVRAIEAGPIIDYVDLPVIPGLWLTEIAPRVDSLPGRDGDEFLAAATAGDVRSLYQPPEVDTLEGLLWPDTYRVSDSESETQILRTMLDQFDQHAADAGLADASVEGLSPYEIVVVASLIQQEARLDEERPLIASVIYNRLRDGTPLQIDATVLYCIGERKVSNTEADRATPCPHNTYLNAGLPPTPIGSITEQSLQAALEPAQTPYRFYVVADEEGSHAFAETFEEHQENVARARELELLG